MKITRDWFEGKKFGNASFKTVSTKAVRKVILGLKNTGATGRDQISTKVLKKFAFILAPVVRHVVNLSIMSSTFPDGWKVGVITPLPKSGDKTDPKNWRPIVINCSLSKVLEVILNRQLVGYMETRAIFSDSQFAYRARRGCGPAWQDLDTQIQQYRNEGLQVALILTDMSAAFNVIKKEVLVPKLAHYGLDESSCKMITNYLSSRKTTTKIEEVVSSMIELDAGVGEGSVVGPTIFICGLCDVPSVAKKTKMICQEQQVQAKTSSLEFADDCSGVAATKTDAELQVAVNVMMSQYKYYFGVNGLCLNDSKCQVIVFRTRQMTQQITLGNVPKVKLVKLLGLYIDSSMNFKRHANEVYSACIHKINALKKVRNYMTEEGFSKIVEALVHGKIRYLIEIYGRSPYVQSRLQKIINAVARVTCKTDRYAHVLDMLARLKWWNAANMYRYELCRLSQHRTAPYTCTLVIRAATHDHVTISRDMKLVWLKKNRYGRDSFIMSAIRLYNELRLNPRWYEDLDDFKSQLKAELRICFKNGNIT